MGFFGPKGVFGYQEQVEKDSEGLLAFWQFGTYAIFDDFQIFSGNGATRIYSIAKTSCHKKGDQVN